MQLSSHRGVGVSTRAGGHPNVSSHSDPITSLN